MNSYGVLAGIAMAAALITAPAPAETVLQPVQHAPTVATAVSADGVAFRGLLDVRETGTVMVNWLDAPGEPEFELDLGRFSVLGASSSVSVSAFAVGRSVHVIHTPVETDLTWRTTQDADFREEDWLDATSVDVPLEDIFIVASR